MREPSNALTSLSLKYNPMGKQRQSGHSDQLASHPEGKALDKIQVSTIPPFSGTVNSRRKRSSNQEHSILVFGNNCEYTQTSRSKVDQQAPFTCCRHLPTE